MSNSSALITTHAILSSLVSYQDSAWASISKQMTIDEALREIKSNKYQRKVEHLRLLLAKNDKEGYDRHKKNLPAVTFCATFNKVRRKEALEIYNSIIVLDVDKLDAPNLERLKDAFSKDSYIFSFWESPSQTGIKGLVQVKYTDDIIHDNIDALHKLAFAQFAAYIESNYNIGLDKSGSDTTRLCFFSFDPHLYLSDAITPFEVLKSEPAVKVEKSESKTPAVKFHSCGNRDLLFNPKGRNNPADRNTVQTIIKFLEKKGLSITNSYESWYKVAMAIANTFTYDIGEKYFLRLSAMDREKFNEDNCRNFLRHCYESRNGVIKFSTIIYYGNKKGYVTKKQRERGSEALDESLSQVSSSQTVYHLPEDLKK